MQMRHHRLTNKVVVVMSVALLLTACTGNTRVAPIEGRTDERPAGRVAQEVPPAPGPSVGAAKAPAETQIFPLPDTTDPLRAPLPVPESDAAAVTPPPVVPPSDPALRELVAQAERASSRGDRGAARATLERALKIKPGDGQLWLRLGELNFADGEYEQAVVMAQRARELARGDSPLIAQADDLMTRAGRHLNP